MKELLSKELNIANDLNCQIGSDYLFNTNTDNNDILKKIVSEKKADVLFILGNIFDSYNGDDTSKKINDLIGNVGKHFENIIYTPGSCDLRGRDNPWGSFDLPDNIIYPGGELDIINTNINDNNILIGNLFFDLNNKFLDILDISKNEIIDYYEYAKIADSTDFLSGNTDIFKNMSNLLRKKINPDTDIIVTQNFPHHSLINFKTTDNNLLLDNTELSYELVDNFDNSSDFSVDINDFVKIHNKDSLLSLSDVLSDNNIKENLVCLYGHNYLQNDEIKKVDDKNIRFISGSNPVGISM